MSFFQPIDNGVALVRLPRGIFAEKKLFHRNGSVYINVGGGFIRIGAKFSDLWATSHPQYKVVEIVGAGIRCHKLLAPSFEA